MSKLILPKATAEQRATATPVAGEIFYDRDNRKIIFGDGATAGGVELYPSDLMGGYVYGIDHDTSIATASQACKRVVCMGSFVTEVDSFAQMPAHNFKRCVVSDPANRVVSYYLNASNSNLRENGNDADMTGADGDIMVEIPITHWRMDTYTDAGGHVHHRYLVSDKAFPGSAIHPFFYVSPDGSTARVQYVGAFRSVLCNAAGTPVSTAGLTEAAAYSNGMRFRSDRKSVV